MGAFSASEPVKLSPLIVTTSGKLILKDYDKEINLTPVHRAVYIFFLLNEEDIMFKDLPLYKDELFAIYSKLSNRTSQESMQQTIDEFSNPFSNAMSEKCSRIKLSFLKEVDERVARHYVIEGSRNTKKRIQLDRSLVQFEGDVFMKG